MIGEKSQAAPPSKSIVKHIFKAVSLTETMEDFMTLIISFLPVVCLLTFVLIVSADMGCNLVKRHLMCVSIAGDSEVVVIDEKQGEVLARIPVGAGPAIILATPDESKLYTANWGDNTVSAIDTRSFEVTHIQLPSRPYVIAMAPDGRYVYAGLYANAIAVIDTQTNSVVQSFATTVLPASLFVSPDGDVLYVATTMTTPGQIWAVSSRTGETIRPAIEIGAAPGWITMSPDGEKVYALNFYSDDISVVDTQSWIVEDTIYTGEGSQGIIGNVSPDNRTLYVTNLGTGDLIAIDTRTLDIFRSVPVNGRPSGVHFNSNASRIYVTDFGPDSLLNPPSSTFLYTGVWTGTDPGYVNVIKAGTGEIAAKVAVGPGPTGVVGICAPSMDRHGHDGHRIQLEVKE